MLDALGSLAGLIGRSLGRGISGRLHGEAADVTRYVRRFSGPLARAFVDAFVAERIATATWPSAVVLTAIIIAHLIATVAPDPERDRFTVGCIVLAAAFWSGYAVVKGALVALPHCRLWLVTQLSPVRHARLLIFQLVQEVCAEFTPGLSGTGVRATFIAELLEGFQENNRLQPRTLAFEIAEDLARVVVLHIAKRLVMLVVPVAAAVCYYRFVVYPDMIANYTSMGPWSVALYPLAALCDLITGTKIRWALQGT
jgi:hypothetical protein